MSAGESGMPQLEVGGGERQPRIPLICILVHMSIMQLRLLPDGGDESLTGGGGYFHLP